MIAYFHGGPWNGTVKEIERVHPCHIRVADLQSWPLHFHELIRNPSLALEPVRFVLYRSELYRLTPGFDVLVMSQHVEWGAVPTEIVERAIYSYLMPQRGETRAQRLWMAEHRARQSLEQMGRFVLNPVFGIDPQRFADAFNRLDPQQLRPLNPPARTCASCGGTITEHYFTSQTDSRDLCQTCFDARADKGLAREAGQPLRKTKHPLDAWMEA